MDINFLYFSNYFTQNIHRTPRPYFHTFEAENGQVGLNFADENEAAKFQKSIEDK